MYMYIELPNYDRSVRISVDGNDKTLEQMQYYESHISFGIVQIFLFSNIRHANWRNILFK